MIENGGVDFRRYDRVWERVAPTLVPYPPGEADNLEQGAVFSGGKPEAPGEKYPAAPGEKHPAAPASGERIPAAAPAFWEKTPEEAHGSGKRPPVQVPDRPQCPPVPLPGDAPETLAAFIEEELSEQRRIQAVMRNAPLRVRQALRDLASQAASHARRLTAVYYLITGERYPSSVSADRSSGVQGETETRMRPGNPQGKPSGGQGYPGKPSGGQSGPGNQAGQWRQALRECYQETVCTGLRYAGAAKKTADPCLSRLLEEMSAEVYRRARELLRMLEYGMGNMNETWASYGT